MKLKEIFRAAGLLLAARCYHAAIDALQGDICNDDAISLCTRTKDMHLYKGISALSIVARCVVLVDSDTYPGEYNKLYFDWHGIRFFQLEAVRNNEEE